MTIVVYGIPNCSSVQKARSWLAAQALDYSFHDFKKRGVDAEQLRRWIALLGLDQVLNRKGTTWRSLSDSEKQLAETPDSAIALLQQKPSLIKRPVIERQGQLLIGFDETRYQQALSQ